MFVSKGKIGACFQSNKETMHRKKVHILLHSHSILITECNSLKTISVDNCPFSGIVFVLEVLICWMLTLLNLFKRHWQLVLLPQKNK